VEHPAEAGSCPYIAGRGLNSRPGEEGISVRGGSDGVCGAGGHGRNERGETRSVRLTGIRNDLDVGGNVVPAETV
jgi:hypothetical protein